MKRLFLILLALVAPDTEQGPINEESPSQGKRNSFIGRLVKKLRGSLNRAGTNRTGVSGTDNGESDQSEKAEMPQQTTSETVTAPNATEGGADSEEKEQAADIDKQETLDKGKNNPTSEESSDNQNELSINENDKIKLLSDFVGKLKSGSLVEPNKDIQELIVECRETLLREGENKERLELAEVIKNSSANATYPLSVDLSSTSDISTYLENLVSIVKAKAENISNEEKEELNKQLENKGKECRNLITKNGTLESQKKNIEQQLEREQQVNASLQEKVSELNDQISGLTIQVQELSNAEPEKISFNSLGASEQEEIKEQIKQEISEGFQLTIDAKQAELNIAYESTKNLNTMIGDLRTQLAAEKDGRDREREEHTDAMELASKQHLLQLEEINTRHQKDLDHQKSLHEAEKAEWKNQEEQLGKKHLQEINELNALHQETLDHQKSLHEAEKAEWEHQEKEFKAKIQKGEKKLKEKLLAAEEAQKRAVQDAVAETEATAKQILDEEIKARKEEREQNESLIQKIKADNVKQKEAIQKKMQKLLDKAIGDCDEIANDRKGERQMLAYEMQQHIARMYQQLSIAFNSSVGYFKEEGAVLIRDAESMYNWYQSAVVSPFQTEDSLTQSEIIEIVQSQSIMQVQDKYSLVSKLTRITAYSQISSLWTEWMSKQGVNTLALRMAYNEMCALMGRCKITLVVPSLFSDIYSNNEIYTLNVSYTPIVNFRPKEFDHLKNSSTPIVRDLSHPGYALDGQIKVGPEVFAQ